MTKRQQQAFQQYWPAYGLSLTNSFYDFNKVFSRKAPTVLEIGFGMGQALLAMAQHYPEYNFIGIDVYRPGVGALLADLAAFNLTNIRIFCADALEVFRECIPDQSLNRINIFFPDPWPKRAHHKRRLIQTEPVNLLVSKLQPDGKLHLATDWQDYADQMMGVLSAHPFLVNSYGAHQFGSREDRATSKFSNRGLKLGHQIWDLIFIKSMR